MTKSELEERIQQALREKREGARFYNPYSLVSVETQTNTYFITQPTMIVRAPETSSLSKLVAETREQMRKKQQASKMPLKYVGGNVGYVSDWSLPTQSDVAFSQQLNLDRPADLSQVDTEMSDQLPLLKQVEPAMAGTSPSSAVGNSPPVAPEAVVIQRAPAAQLHLAKRTLEPEVYRRYVEPHLADMWLQYNEALCQGNEREARRVVLRGYNEVLKPLLYGALRMVIRWWLRLMAMGRVQSHAIWRMPKEFSVSHLLAGPPLILRRD